MKVYSHERQPMFTPIQITISLESNQELECLAQLARLDVSVPKEVAERLEVSFAESVMKTMLQQLAVALRPYR